MWWWAAGEVREKVGGRRAGVSGGEKARAWCLIVSAVRRLIVLPQQTGAEGWVAHCNQKPRKGAKAQVLLVSGIERWACSAAGRCVEGEPGLSCCWLTG